MQALSLLNDPTYVEAARKLAERVMLQADNDKARLTLAFRIVLTRLPDDTEQKLLLDILSAAREHFARDSAAAEEFLSVGHSKRDMSINTADLAAWATAMSVLLNLDESISKL